MELTNPKTKGQETQRHYLFLNNLETALRFALLRIVK